MRTERKTHKRNGPAKADNAFLLAILFTLIGGSVFSGGAALLLALQAANEATVSVAEIPSPPGQSSSP
jgi:hypothetical protein